MIAQLKGYVVEVGTESAVFDVQGVGYDLICSLQTLADLQERTHPSGAGASFQATLPVTVFCYTHVREDVLQLFGFSTKMEKQLFTTLLKVNGIGPKMAVNILSGASVEQIHAMVEAEDVKALSKLPKVGKKTAEQMILALKGKLVLNPDTAASKAGSKVGAFAPSTHLRDLASALVNLGFRPQDVEKVVADMPADMDLQQGLRQGLAALGGMS